MNTIMAIWLTGYRMWVVSFASCFLVCCFSFFGDTLNSIESNNNVDLFYLKLPGKSLSYLYIYSRSLFQSFSLSLSLSRARFRSHTNSVELSFVIELRLVVPYIYGEPTIPVTQPSYLFLPCMLIKYSVCRWYVHIYICILL